MRMRHYFVLMAMAAALTFPAQASADQFLADFRDRPRTHNAYRSQLGELMRYAMERGLRDPGTNPVTDLVRTKRTKARTRYITDSELRRIKVAGMYGDDARRTRRLLLGRYWNVLKTSRS